MPGGMRGALQAGTQSMLTPLLCGDRLHWPKVTLQISSYSYLQEYWPTLIIKQVHLWVSHQK